MPILRNELATSAAGGRRQFAELREKLIVVTEAGKGGEVVSEATSIGLSPTVSRNAPVVQIEPESKIEDTIESLGDIPPRISRSVDQIQEARAEGEGFIGSTKEILRATNEIINNVSDFDGVRNVDFAHTFVDYGPENLRLDVPEFPLASQQESEKQNQQNIIESLNIDQAWEVTRGKEVGIAIFDTGYAKDLVNSSRIKGTFHSDEVDSVWAPEEGHGTMCLGASAANSDEGVPYDGVAPEAKVFLVRTTGPEGQIRSDVITEAWDWLIDQSKEIPIVANHSYGTPLCSAPRRPTMCNNGTAEMIEVANSENNITSCYAAGNEAMYCGHRPSGITNGITGHNSIHNVITVGALLSNGSEAQRYSSHGKGDCAPTSDPKPNCSYRIPRRLYYGGEDGWVTKDMSTGVFGSGGGTSCASPLTAGAVALLQSAAVEGKIRGEPKQPLQVEKVKNIIENNSEPPRRTQINQTGLFRGPEGWDARFGYGQFRIDKALAAN